MLKAISEKIIHKWDVGAVKLNLGKEEDVEKAFKELSEKFRDSKILAQEMIEGVEVFLGAKRDKIFGWVLSFGMGGLFVEVYEDISMRLAPIEMEEALKMIKEIKGYKILRGYRGRKVKVRELARIISKFSKHLDKIGGREIDLNPIICNEEGCWVVDFRVIR